MYALLLAFLLQVGIHGCAFATRDVQAAGDLNFTKFLISRMTEYGKWIQEYKLDPSTPIPDSVLLPTSIYNRRLKIHCTVRNQIISGHSTTEKDSIIAGADFERHHFTLGRIVRSPYEFKGKYTCAGYLYAWAFAELKSDLPFNSNGTFTVRITSSNELIEYHNFGVTHNYTLNKTHSWFDYEFYPNEGEATLVGLWESWTNDTVSKYGSVVARAFRTNYVEFLSGEKKIPEAHLNPSRQIFVRFVDELIRNTKLSEVLSLEELPPPHKSIPTTTTTTTTTRRSTESMSSTTNKHSDTTTLEPNGSTFVVSFKLWVVALVTFLIVRSNSL